MNNHEIGIRLGELVKSERRITNEILKAVPGVQKKLEAGVINLSTLCKASSVMKSEQKRSGEKFSDEEKRQVLDKIENQTSEEADRFPEGQAADVIAHVLGEFLQKNDPLRKVTSAAEAKRVTREGIRRTLIQSSKSSCGYRDPKTGGVCGSRHQLQIDHIQPRALGGTDQPENLQALCRKHNFWRAELTYGRKRMERYRRSSVEGRAGRD